MCLSVNLRCVIPVTAVLILSASSSKGSEELIQLVYAEASRAWASEINRFLEDPSELHVTIRENGADRRVAWVNYSSPRRRMIRSESTGFIHVLSVNEKHTFWISARASDEGAFWLSDIKKSATSLAPPETYELFIPEASFLGYPLICIARRDLVNIDSVEPENGNPSQLVIKGSVKKSGRISEPPIAFFHNNLLKGTEFEVRVLRGGAWALRKATVRYPHGTIWEQDNSVDASGVIVTKVKAESAGSITRQYSRTLSRAVLRPFDEKPFYLSHYGLSESTAGFLRQSRQYILVFCGLFFGAIFFQVLAYVAKRRRTKQAEGA